MSLKSRIAALIEAQGPMSVAQYMAVALLDPKEGYYATRDPFGRKPEEDEKGGDFITAPEISQMFGEMLGLWLVQAWADQGCPKNPLLVELGPGRGTLMKDVLRAAAIAPEFTADLEVVLVEASPVLQALQAEMLRGSGASISWQTQFDASLADRPLFLVANEFFDALPVRQYVRAERGWCERMVTAFGDDLTFALAPTPVPPATIPADREAAPMGGVYESSPASTALVEEIAAIIASKGGAALIMDYGYGETDVAAGGFAETLQAVRRHGFADVLEQPGEADLSSHVDFAALGRAGKRGGAAVFGPIGQGHFLAGIGITERAQQLIQANPQEAASVIAATERLIGADTASGQMGALFKALAIVPASHSDVAGFSA